MQNRKKKKWKQFERC